MKHSETFSKRIRASIWLCIFPFLFFSAAFGQESSSEWLGPHPQGNTLNDIAYLSSRKIFFVGDAGTMLITQNMGMTWETVETPTSEDLMSITFVSPTKGFAVGRNGAALKTENGGRTWKAFNTGSSELLYDIHFQNEQRGFIVGFKGTLLKTTNGGDYWEKVPLDRTVDLKAIAFSNVSTGFAVGSKGTIVKTTDGGNTWVKENLVPAYPVQAFLSGISFSNPYNGFIPVDRMSVFTTFDGGRTWGIKKLSNYGIGAFQHLAFADRQRGIAVGTNGAIFTTENGGANWNASAYRDKGEFKHVSFIDGQNAFILGEGGKIIRTMDGGNTWSDVSRETDVARYMSISFPTPQKGYVLKDDGHYLTTNNGGRTWQASSQKINARSYTNEFREIHFFDEYEGFAYMSTGSFFKTRDGGNSWRPFTAVGASEPKDVFFVDENIGYVIGGSNLLLKTNDGGNSWTSISTSIRSLSALSFINQQVGFVGGERGQVLFTKDGGISWRVLSTGASDAINAVHFFSEWEGVAVARNYSRGTKIFYTRDGGTSWSNTYLRDQDLLKMDFSTDQRVGIAYGANGNFNVTYNRGRSWQAQNIGTSNYLFDVYFESPSSVLVAGGNGNLLRVQLGNNQNVRGDDYADAEEGEDRPNHIPVQATVILNGARVEVANVRPIGHGNFQGQLAKDVSIALGSNTLTLQGGKPITYNKTGGFVTSATLKTDAYIYMEIGRFVVPSGSKVELQKSRIEKAKLKQSVVFESAGGDVPASISTAPFDVAFDGSGEVSYAILSQDASYTLNRQRFTFPKSSIIELKEGRINAVKLGREMPVSLGATTLMAAKISSSMQQFSMEFSPVNGELKKMRVAAGQTMVVDGSEKVLAENAQLVINWDASGGCKAFLVRRGGGLSPIQLDKSTAIVQTNERRNLTKINRGNFHQPDQKETLEKQLEKRQEEEAKQFQTVSVDRDGNEGEEEVQVETVSLNGSDITVENPKPVSEKFSTATLKEDTKVAVGSNTVTLKGGEAIQYNTEKKYIASGTVAEAASFQTQVGTFKAQSNSKISFNSNRVSSVILAEDAVLKSPNGEIPCKANNNGQFDVVFDASGEVAVATLSQKASYTLDGRTFAFPERSKLALAGGRISNVFLSTSMPLEAAGYTFNVSATATGTSIDFQPGNGIIREFLVAAGHTVEVDGFQIPIKADSRVVLEKSGSNYVLSKIFLEKDMYLKITKSNGKVKERTVKAGRKLVIEHGKIVKATW